MSRTATLAALVLACAFFTCPRSAGAAGAPDLGCSLRFSLSTWSTLQRHSEGSGIVTCENGDVLRVRIVATGAGLASSQSFVDGGSGTFADVHSLGEIFGVYAEATEGARVRTSAAQVLSKGPVSLALAGRGHGVDLGVGISEFILTRSH